MGTQGGRNGLLRPFVDLDGFALLKSRKGFLLGGGFANRKHRLSVVEDVRLDLVRQLENRKAGLALVERVTCIRTVAARARWRIQCFHLDRFRAVLIDLLKDFS
jgi:hypothetical protein